MAVDHETQPEPEVVAAPAIASPAAAAAGPAAQLLSLQKRAGNRAVLSLMRQQAPPKPRQAVLNIVVERAMTPHEFAVRAFMQAFRMPGDIAERRVSAIEAAGGRPGTGPNFEHGVTLAEVGKPLKLNYPLPALTEAEQADVEGRKAQLAGLPAEQRSAIDEETDRR